MTGAAYDEGERMSLDQTILTGFVTGFILTIIGGFLATAYVNRIEAERKEQRRRERDVLTKESAGA